MRLYEWIILKAELEASRARTAELEKLYSQAWAKTPPNRDEDGALSEIDKARLAKLALKKGLH